MPAIEFLLLIVLSTASTATVAANTVLPSCQSKCGNIDIPYPFGIGEGCYAGNYGDFSIRCDSNSTAFLSRGNIPLLDISLNGDLRVRGLTGYACYDRAGKSNISEPSINLSRSPYSFSHTRNRFFVIGCDANCWIWDQYGTRYSGGCMSYCESRESFRGLADGDCSGLGCCKVSIPRGIRNFTTGMRTYYNYRNSMDFNNCGFIFLAEENQYNFTVSDLESNRLSTQRLPIVLDWSIGTQNCEQAKKNRSIPYACRSGNSECVESKNGVGYLCNCSKGFQGNPYLQGDLGCRDIDECVQSPPVCPSKATCVNNVGGYTCTCPHGYRLNVNITGGCEDIDECKQNPCSAGEYCVNKEGSHECRSRSGLSLGLKLGLGVGGGLLALVAAGAFTCWGVQRRNLADQTRKVADFKRKMFEQNGGPLLQQQLLSQPGNTFRIFTEAELAMATGGFAEDKIVGRGGHGVVYLGTLEDNTAVAVKRSKKMDERESKEFAREMAILSQINHVNVVKILGCCVEVEVPMLVYEFVPGGTLYDLIHGRKGKQPISFKLSLKIAREVAESLAYLHSYASPPVLHKDIKTSNVLLDDNFTAKISDFGASCTAPADGAEIATMVQGTIGYLDPEYLQTYMFTDKSDVYSFGVVLVELLTRRKPFQAQGPEEERGVVMSFLSFLNQGKLENILHPQVMNEADMDTLREIAELAGRCLCSTGADRPTMKDVSMALQLLRPNCERPWVPPHGAEEAESLLDREQSMACDSVEVASRYLETTYQTVLEIGDGR